MDKAKLDELLLTNRFSLLKLDKAGDDDGLSEDDAGPAKQRRQAKPGKGKRGNKKGAKKTTTPKAGKDELQDIPLEGYQIIQDEDGATSEYYLAAASLVKDFVNLRLLSQDVWKEVAYDGLNSAVAASMSNMTVAIVQKISSSMFVDFPGRDSFESVLNAIVRGNIEERQEAFTATAYAVDPKTGGSNVVQKRELDITEIFLYNTYNDLVDFIADFQKNHTGKPTKRMEEHLKKWDPKLDIQSASKEERLQWRRLYTINWLYDLVNIFSSVVVQRNANGEKHELDKVDWSVNGPWAKHRRLFGLNQFAGFVTTLAMQKSGIDFKHRILTQHVFQLALIVDSFTISRGWSHGTPRGHILESPPSAFRALRDVDLFLDREDKREFRGFLHASKLYAGFYKDNPKPSLLKSMNLSKAINADFKQWLGNSKYTTENTMKPLPPSRFSTKTSGGDPNGLWSNSPYLCGAGLVEALDIAYLLGLKLVDNFFEVFLMVHLYNFLIRTGYLRTPNRLFQTLMYEFQDALFARCQIPTSNFVPSLANSYIQAQGREDTRGTSDPYFIASPDFKITDIASPEIFEALSLKRNLFLQRNSYLGSMREANWDIDQFPEADILITSRVGMYHLYEAYYTHKQNLNSSVPLKGRGALLLERAKAQCPGGPQNLGRSLEEMFKTLHTQRAKNEAREAISRQAVLAQNPGKEDITGSTSSSRGRGDGGLAMGLLTLPELILTLKDDFAYAIVGDVRGTSPVSVLNNRFNFISAASVIYNLFQNMEYLINDERKIKVFDDIYRKNMSEGAAGGSGLDSARFNLILAAMKREIDHDKDRDGLLSAMAEVFRGEGTPDAHHFGYFWGPGEPDNMVEAVKKRTEMRKAREEIQGRMMGLPREPATGECSVM